MTSRIKGFYSKSFKCFSNFFVMEEKEMQIGNPTNVRHVAHIGWDNSSTSLPSWINEFKTSHEVSPRNTSRSFQGFDQRQEFGSAIEAFDVVLYDKDLRTESKKQKGKKKSSLKSSTTCNPWTPRSCMQK